MIHTESPHREFFSGHRVYSQDTLFSEGGFCALIRRSGNVAEAEAYAGRPPSRFQSSGNAGDKSSGGGTEGRA